MGSLLRMLQWSDAAFWCCPGMQHIPRLIHCGGGLNQALANQRTSVQQSHQCASRSTPDIVSKLQSYRMMNDS